MTEKMKTIQSDSVTRLPAGTKTERSWCGRDENAAHHHGTIPANQKVITITLRWKASRDGAESEIGRYRINLPGLEAEGYIEKRAAGYYLRFQRTGTRIEIAVNRHGNALQVGYWP